MIEKEHDPLSEKITFLGHTGTAQVQVLFAGRWSLSKTPCNLNVTSLAILSSSSLFLFWSYSTSTGIEKAISQPRNPVSLRLYKVLSPNFDDDTRQALVTLSDLYATPKGKDTLEVVEGVSWTILFESMPHVSQRCWQNRFLENLQWGAKISSEGCRE